MNLGRDSSIDIIRGIAIFTMVAANMAAHSFIAPHPFIFRLYGTFAAPIFIFLSGMMVGYAHHLKKYKFNYYLVRGGLILLVGVLLDVICWRTLPFTTVDVLYLIGISMPLAGLFVRMNDKIKPFIIILIFALTPLLQKIFGYTDYPSEWNLSGELNSAAITTNQTSVLHHWLIDGWFPLFPWLGIALLGSMMAKFRIEDQNKFSNRSLYFAISSLAVGITLWNLFPGKSLTRDGYSELFYPPTLGYLFTALGIIFSLFFIVGKIQDSKLLIPWRMLGSASLFMYIFHYLIIAFVISPFVEPQSLKKFIMLYLMVITLLTAVAFWIYDLKQKRKTLPFLVRFFIGS